METARKKPPQINSAADVTAVLQETDRFLRERGMYICPWEGVSIKLDGRGNGRQRARLTIAALDRTSVEYWESLTRPDGTEDSPH